METEIEQQEESSFSNTETNGIVPVYIFGYVVKVDWFISSFEKSTKWEKSAMTVLY